MITKEQFLEIMNKWISKNPNSKYVYYILESPSYTRLCTSDRKDLDRVFQEVKDYSISNLNPPESPRFVKD